MYRDLLKNCTPHPISIVQRDGSTLTIPPSGELARVSTVESPPGDLDGVMVIRREFGEVTIPDPPTVDVGDGAELVVGWIIVSSLVLEAAKTTRHHLLGRLLAPDTGPSAIREGGQVVAVRQMVKV